MRLAVPKFFLFYAVLSMSAVSAQTSAINGNWLQITSNAGSCDSCYIDISNANPGLFISASNGWAATVMGQDTGGDILAIGQGRWKQGRGGAYGGQGFLVKFETLDRQLHMEMRVPDKSGRVRVIQAIFVRNRPSN